MGFLNTAASLLLSGGFPPKGRVGACHVTAAAFLPPPGFDDSLQSPRWGQGNRGPPAHCLLGDKCAFMQPSAGDVIQCVSTNRKCEEGVNFFFLIL